MKRSKNRPAGRRVLKVSQSKLFLAVLALSFACLGAEPQTLRFDAASVKPVAGRTAESGNTAQQIALAMRELHMQGVAARKIPMPDPGRVVIRNSSLVEIVAMAYGVSTTQVRCPEWMEDDDYEVIATVPPGHAGDDDVRLMLQSLLKNRFGLAVHHEEKNLPGYALEVGKGGPRLQKSSDQPPDSATPQLTAKDLNEKARAAGQNAVVAYMRVTVDSFAGRLTQLLQAPVRNVTGIEGLYDFTLYSTFARVAESPRDALDEAMEPLGLKLSPRRLLTDTLVIDKAERRPTEDLQ